MLIKSLPLFFRPVSCSLLVSTCVLVSFLLMYLCHHFECVQLTKLRILDLQLAIVLADIELTTGKRIETFYVSHVSIYENIFTHFSLSMILTIHLKFKWMFFFSLIKLNPKYTQTNNCFSLFIFRSISVLLLRCWIFIRFPFDSW